MLVRQAASATAASLLREDDEQAMWWGTWAECTVAISRLRREGRLNEEAEKQARARLDRLATDWAEVEPADDMRLLASLLSKEHPLRAADALQLAALRWCEGDTRNTGFVCLDDRLRRAASEEGFDVLPVAEEDG